MTEEKKIPLEQAAANASDAPRSEESGVGTDAAATLSVINSVNLEAARHLAASAAPTGERATSTPDKSAAPEGHSVQGGMEDQAAANATDATAAATEAPHAAIGDASPAEAVGAAETAAAAAAGSGGQPPLPPASPFPPDASEPVAPVPATSGGQPPATPDDEEEEESGPSKPMGLMDHLGELRTRLVRCSIAVFVGFFACWAVVDPIFNFLVNPLLAVLPKGSHAIYTTLPEAFFTRMHIAFVAGVFVSSPVIFYQVWSFIAPGLYEEEKKYIIPIAVMSALFFICGGAFCYFVVFPYAFSFFVSFATEEIVAMPKVSDYLSFVLKLILAFGLIFEMPLFAFFLARMGVVTAAMMRQVRRYAILSIFLVAAVLTPPDVVSQLLMACPMLILYEISIWVAAAFGRKPKTEKTAADGEQEKPDAAAAADAKTANASEKA